VGRRKHQRKSRASIAKRVKEASKAFERVQAERERRRNATVVELPPVPGEADHDGAGQASRKE
jgi:hypothetical protein